MYVQDTDPYRDRAVYAVMNPDDVPPTMFTATIAGLDMDGLPVGVGPCRISHSHNKPRAWETPKTCVECYWDTERECFIVP